MSGDGELNVSETTPEPPKESSAEEKLSVTSTLTLPIPAASAHSAPIPVASARSARGSSRSPRGNASPRPSPASPKLGQELTIPSAPILSARRRSKYVPPGEPQWEEDIPIFDSQELNDNMLKVHNDIRDRHGSPALEYCDQARKWAHLAVADSAKQDRIVTHHTGKDHGQSLFVYKPFESGLHEDFATSIVAHAVEAWYGEQEFWDFDKSAPVDDIHAHSASPDRRKVADKHSTKHFTQLIWKMTQTFGCAVARSTSGHWYVACNYHPAGNVRRQYKNNVFPVGYWSEDDEEALGEDAASPSQSLSSSRFRETKRGFGKAALRSQFKLGGELEILDETSQEWCHCVIIKMGRGETVAEYAHPHSGEKIEKRIHLDDMFIRVPANLIEDRSPSPKKKEGTKKAKAQAPSAKARAKRAEEEAAQKHLEELCDRGKTRMRDEAGIGESRIHEDVQHGYYRTELGFDSAAPEHVVAEERVRRVRRAFREWDVDGSGSISKQELAFVFQDLGMPVEQSGLLFDAVDLDRNGEIDFEEFLQWILE
jgi:uncharacterized protein YkwD